MNIRQGFLALAAMILGVGFLGAFPQQAQAQVITCTDVPKSITDWPYAGSTNAAKYCGTATVANGVTVADSLHQLPGGYLESAYTLMKNKPFYVFKNKTEFQTYWSQTNPGVPPNPSDTAAAFTVYTASSPFTPLYTAVFVQSKDSNGNTINSNMRNGAVHEVGHWLDYFHRAKFSGATSKATEGTNFLANLAIDWDNFNNKPACGTGGVFRAKLDRFGNQICSGTGGTGPTLSSTYSPYPNNKSVLTNAWPQFLEYPKEVFAEEFAADNNAPDGNGASSLTQYLSGFTCTKAIVHSLGDYGTKPGTAPTHDAAGNPVSNGPVVTWIPSTPGGQIACQVNLN